MPITKLHPTFTFDEDRLAQLRAVVPEAFADGRINWETLRAALGEHLEDDEADAEHFGLFWPGKRAARRLASQPSRGTLVPQPGLGVNEATTRHLFIEGDNLEVLKLLLKSYAGQVKLIYIDPPYNTGNDFIYSDDFTEPLEAYLRRTGQVDEAGQPLTTNPKASGRFHSNWLNMMYPRLLLARQLLREDGVIFVSIDDNEVYHLRQMMNEIFGDENFVAQLVWKKKYTGGKHTSFYVDMHEYVLVYARAREIIAGFTIERPEEQKEKFEYSDEYESERGKYYVRPLKSNLASRPTLVYPIELPDGTVIETQWLVSRVTFDRMVEEGRIEFRQKRNGEYQVYKKYYERDDEGRVKVPSFIEGISNNDAKQELKELFGITEGRDNVFYTVKPTTLIKYLFRPFIGEDDIIMDFFAGSASTAHATLALDQEDGGNRRFIMVQLPEPTGNLTYPTIADIGRERIRRVIARMQAEAAGQETTDADRPAPDLGFRSYRLARSHFKAWQDYTGEQAAELETLFTQFESPLVESWEPSALLTELLLLEGFPLDSRVRPLPAFTANTLLEVSSDFCAHRLTVCLDARLHPETLAALDLRAEDTFICLESALDDEAKLRLADRCNLKVV